MDEVIRVKDRVKIRLEPPFWQAEGWFEGVVVRIDPYSQHRRFYWVELDQEVQPVQGGSIRLISVLNPKNILKT